VNESMKDWKLGVVHADAVTLAALRHGSVSGTNLVSAAGILELTLVGTFPLFGTYISHCAKWQIWEMLWKIDKGPVHDSYQLSGCRDSDLTEHCHTLTELRY
jgi:hypothetical protein